MDNFSIALQWVIHHGYILMFFGMLAEGPIITAVSSFAASLGFFNIGVVFILAILGDWGADLIFFAIGYFTRLKLVRKFGNLFGISEEKIESLKNLLETHPGKILVAAKLSPLAVPALIIAGSSHMSVKKFGKAALFISLPKTILFVVVGYYFGRSYNTIHHYIDNGFLLIFLGIVAFGVFYFLYKQLEHRISGLFGRI